MAVRIGSPKADETYDISQYISSGPSDESTYYNYSILDYINGFEVPITNLIYDYMDELEDMAKTVVLTDEQFVKYRYKPWLLAYDIYGSEESSFIIFALNGILCDREFDFKRLKIITPSELNTILGRIASVNDQFLNDNRAMVKNKEKNDETGNTVW